MNNLLSIDFLNKAHDVAHLHAVKNIFNEKKYYHFHEGNKKGFLKSNIKDLHHPPPKKKMLFIQHNDY